MYDHICLRNNNKVKKISQPLYLHVRWNYDDAYQYILYRFGYGCISNIMEVYLYTKFLQLMHFISWLH